MDLSVRPARQRRSREGWARILDAGVAVLSEQGADGFTIAAVCDRAGVTPPSIYRRAPSKDALFLAVYEHGIDQIRSTEATVMGEAQGAAEGESADVVVESVVAVGRIFLAHRGFLQSVILISALNSAVRERGVDASHDLAAIFDHLTDPVTSMAERPARAALFQMVFAALVLRTAFGPEFASPAPVDDAEFLDGLAEVARRWRQSSPSHREPPSPA